MRFTGYILSFGLFSGRAICPPLFKNEIPDVIVNVVVASNLERNLYLTTELIDMDYRMVIALNMFDELEQSGGKIDYKHLGNMIGVPIVPTVSRSGKGVNQLFDTIIEVYEGRDESVRHVHVGLGKVIENSITPLKDLLKKTLLVTGSSHLDI